jgi:hypothetical protein
MLSLPPQINAYVAAHYQHYYGSLFIYAPVIMPKQINFHLAFSGKYRVDSASNANIKLDGKRVKPGQVVQLTKANHTNDANTAYRLVLQPKIDPALWHPEYQANHYLRMLKAIML